MASEDLNDKSPEALHTWDVHASPSIISGFLFDASPSEPTAPSGEDPIDARAIRQTTASLTSLDFQLGGGHTRQLLLGYFRGQVLPGLAGSFGARTYCGHVLGDR